MRRGASLAKLRLDVCLIGECKLTRERPCEPTLAEARCTLEDDAPPTMVGSEAAVAEANPVQLALAEAEFQQRLSSAEQHHLQDQPEQ